MQEAPTWGWRSGSVLGARAARLLRQAVAELTERATSAGTINVGTTGDDVTTLISAMRGLIHTAPDATPHVWHRFLDIHLAGLATPAPLDE